MEALYSILDSKFETCGCMTLILRLQEEKWINQIALVLVSPQVQHLFCFRQRSLSLPLMGGLKRGLSDWRTVPFSASLAWQWVASAWLNGGFCVWKEGSGVCVIERRTEERRVVTSWKHYSPHAQRHTDPFSHSVLWPCADLSQYLVHLSTGDLLILLSTHHSLSNHYISVTVCEINPNDR